MANLNLIIASAYVVWHAWVQDMFQMDIYKHMTLNILPTWAMSRVSCVCESKLAPDWCGRGVSGSEHFGRSHQFSPVTYGVLSG